MADIAIPGLTAVTPVDGDSVPYIRASTGFYDARVTWGNIKTFLFNNTSMSGTTVFGGGQFTSLLRTTASSTGNSGFRLGYPGVAPTTPVDGDMWVTAAGTFVRINGATQQLVPTSALATVATSGSYNDLSNKPALGAGDVAGPASSVSGNLPTFNGTGGKTLQDSGILATSLAPKLDPSFSGTATFGGGQFTGLLRTTTTSAGNAGFRLGYGGTAPTSPVDGDVWAIGNYIFTRLNGVTYRQAVKEPNAQVVTTAATVTPTFDNDLVQVTALTSALNIANPTGTAVNGTGLVIELFSAAAQSLTYGNLFQGLGVTLPTTTVAGKRMVITAYYSSAAVKWLVMSAVSEA